MASLKALLTQIKTALDDDDFGFTDKPNLMREIMDTLIDLQKKHGTQVYLEFQYKIVSFSNPTTKKPYHIINQKLPEQEVGVYVKGREVEKFQNAVKEFKKFGLKRGEEVMMYHNKLREYRLMTWKEMMEDIKNSEGELKLMDCNVRNWKWGNKKYIRFTVVAKSTTYCGTSGMEFAFGQMIDGFSYLVESDLWKSNKYELFDAIECEETIYGKNTRWDIGGKVYDKKA